MCASKASWRKIHPPVIATYVEDRQEENRCPIVSVHFWSWGRFLVVLQYSSIVPIEVILEEICWRFLAVSTHFEVIGRQDKIMKNIRPTEMLWSAVMIQHHDDHSAYRWSFRHPFASYVRLMIPWRVEKEEQQGGRYQCLSSRWTPLLLLLDCWSESSFAMSN